MTVPTAESPARGLKAILVATAIAGVFGYAIQLLAPTMIVDNATYVTFSVFWSTLYFGVSAMSGVQQEVARASRPVSDEPPSAVLRNFTLAAAGVVAALSAVVATLFGEQVLGGHRIELGVVLAIGFIGYLANSVLSGVLYGLSLWRPVAELIVLDVALRALLVIVGFALQVPTTVLAVAVALPFGAAFGIVWLRVRSSVVGHYRLDVSSGRLTSHVLGTVGAAAASGVMVSGLPMLIGVTSEAAPEAAVGSLILAITLTRAPIVIPVIALQSFLITAVFRGGRIENARLFRLLGVALAGVGALSALGALIGPPLVAWISGDRFEITSWMAAAIVGSAGLVAAMCVTGPALIAARAHLANLIGWTVSAVLTVAALVLPYTLDMRAGIALLVPPAVGLAIHVVSLVAVARRRASAPG